MDDGERMRVPDDAKTSQRLRNVHGGCFMTFADPCLLRFRALQVLKGPGVTASCSCEFSTPTMRAS
jgi:acyl-coenzyme A thioesterase PaaI-like protein